MIRKIICVVASIALAGAAYAAEPYSLSDLIVLEYVPITAEDQETGEEILYQALLEKAKAKGKEPASRDGYLAPFWGNWGPGDVFTGLPDYVFISLLENYVLALYRPASRDAAAPQHEVLIEMGLLPAELFSQPVMGDKKFLAQLANILNSNAALRTPEGISQTAPLIAYIYHWYCAWGGISIWGTNPALVSLAEEPEAFLTELTDATPGTHILLNTLPKGGVYTDAAGPGSVAYIFYTLGGIPRVLRQWVVVYVPEEGFEIKEVLIGQCR